MFIPWTDDLLTGIRVIDLQHKEWVEAANLLHEQLSKPDPDAKAVQQMLSQLVDYTHKHFAMEEELFERARYPDAAAHKAEHRSFKADIARLLSRHEQGERISPEALDLLNQWLVQHIMKLDRAYVPLLVAK